jgi:tryptophanyl-tRNA synthetase
VERHFTSSPTTTRSPPCTIPRRFATHRSVALDFLACGLDPKKAVLFRQSDVPEVTELAWLLTCLTPIAMLENCHAYKDHLAKGKVPLTACSPTPSSWLRTSFYNSNIVAGGAGPETTR